MTADATNGVWTYVMELARVMSSSEVEILIAVMGPTISPEQRAEAVRLEHVGLCEKPFALEWMKDPWRDVTETGDWLLELEEQFQPSVIHLNHYCHGSLPWTAPVVISAHGCVLSWWQAVHGEKSPHSWTRYHAEVSAGLRGANLVVASTRAMLDSLTRLYTPVPHHAHFQNASRSPEFRVIPHGRNSARFRPLAKRDFVLSVGRVGNEAQNFETLNTVASGLPWPIILTGRGPLPDGHDSACSHLTYIEAMTSFDLASKLGHASIFAMPARYDPFGFTALEAALSGCALVLGDIPTLRETWGDAAYFAPADDHLAFGAVLHGLIEDAALRSEMANRARQRALEFSPEQMARCMFECYQQLATPRTAAMEMDVR